MKKLLFLSALIAFVIACEEKEEPPKITANVTLNAPEILSVGLYDAQVEGRLSFEGATELSAKDFGLVWSTTSQAEPADSIQKSWSTKTASTINQNPFPIFDIARNLELNTTYYTRAYFVHEDNTVIYSSESTFTTLAGDAWHKHDAFPGEFDQWPAGFAIGHKIYLGIGLVNESTVSSVNDEWWEYDLNTAKWTQKADFPGNVGIRAAGFSIGNKGYILSSNQEENPAPFWEYDPATDQWAKKADFPGEGRMNPMSFAINGKGYIGGGLSAPEDLWEFDPSDASTGMDINGNPLGKWTQKDYYPGEDVYRPSVFVIDLQAYVYNSYATRNEDDERIIESEFWVYNPANDTWFQKADFPGETRQKMIAFNVNTKGYMGGGRYTDFWEYNPATNQWTQKNDAPDSDVELSFSIDDRGYFFSTFNTLNEYVP